VKISIGVLASILFIFSVLGCVVSPVRASELLVWEAEVWSSGEEVVSPVLRDGKMYSIVASEIWWYNYPENLAADAYYYTTDFSNSWNWGNFFPAPDGHSFLQINGEDVDWGPFSNGDTGHTYKIYYTGEGTPITFKIVDWLDGNYENNVCKINVKIYEHFTVGGYIVDSYSFEILVLLPILSMFTVFFLIYFKKNIR